MFSLSKNADMWTIHSNYDWKVLQTNISLSWFCPEWPKIMVFGHQSSISGISLKWSFTYKQHARGPPRNHSWKFDLTPFQTGIFKINAGFAEKMPKKVEIITRTTANYVLVILVWGFWPKSPIFWPNFEKIL